MAAKVDVQYIRFYTDGSAAKQVTPLFPEEKSRIKLKMQACM